MALLGAVIILRPGFRDVEDGHLAMLLCAVVFAGGYLTAKILADEAPAALVVAARADMDQLARGQAIFALCCIKWRDKDVKFCRAQAGYAPHGLTGIKARTAFANTNRPFTRIRSDPLGPASPRGYRSRVSRLRHYPSRETRRSATPARRPTRGWR